MAIYRNTFDPSRLSIEVKSHFVFVVPLVFADKESKRRINSAVELYT